MGGTGSGRRKHSDADWTPAPGTNAWERQPGETHQAWRAFKTYRDIDSGRTMLRAAKKLGKPDRYIGTMQVWSRQHHWQRRVDEWDRHQDRQDQQTAQRVKHEVTREMVDRHLKISNHIQRLATVEVLRWIHKVGADSTNPDLQRRPTLTPQQIQNLLDYAIKLERLNRNEPESITESRSSELTTEEVEARIAHLLQARDEDDE